MLGIVVHSVLILKFTNLSSKRGLFTLREQAFVERHGIDYDAYIEQLRAELNEVQRQLNHERTE